MTEDKMVEWHYRRNRHELEQTLEKMKDRKSGVLQCMESQRVGHDLVNEQQHLGNSLLYLQLFCESKTISK